MRPYVLNDLFTDIRTLPGIGPKLAPLVEKLVGGPHVVDMLWHLPSGMIDRRSAPPLNEVRDGQVITVLVRVLEHHSGPTPRSPTRIVCADGSGARLHLVYFHLKRKFLETLLPIGSTRVVSGKVEMYRDEPQMTHPDHVGPPEDLDSLQRVEPVYPMTAGVQPRTLGKAMAGALARVPAEMPEWLDPSVKDRRHWSDWSSTIRAAHAPEDEEDLSPLSPIRQRLAYDELLANQLALLLVRASQKKLAGRSLQGDGRLRANVLEALPFSLTGAQERSLKEIGEDMAAESRMLRLLQGDVGSGKTVVALLAMLNAVETGAQAALMAPTEILARQHLATLEPLAEAAGVRMALLTGRDKGKAREALLGELQAGFIDIIVGTHALFSEDVVFRDLAMAVIDEQHRFGVHQRLQLAAKGRHPDILVMTATPIPRTLSLTLYGDMDSSKLDEKPPGRKPVDTRTASIQRLDEIVGAVRRKVDSGAKVYWVCPLVEESEVSDLAAAEARHAHLRETFGDRVGLVHGKMKGADKDAVMEAFAGEGLDVLVATTVIEVGVNVPEATVMVIEHADRFGLAQLHQLRGRIGRGDKASTCLLLFGEPVSETARARLSIMKETEDGFRIAEEDLRLRGGGEVLGTRQAGMPEFRVADLAIHGELLAMARDDARLIVGRDPNLDSERGKALRVLLYLFERDEGVRTLRSG
ncbi:ATP-dependent DNA helicase RecG [Caenispirillum salinarum]|uniref:ATP-dependent DNA helicase RecG n=1 Tax=Caenispirillum salinarum TaxID=859058 RepID=UPI00384DAE30